MNWFQTKSAKSLILQEKKIINKFIEDKFGYHALQLGSSFTNFLENSRISNHIFNQGPLKNISFNNFSFPLADDSIDLVICSHYIEQGYNSIFLEELYRIIIPGGHLVLISFNPFSFAGIRNIFGFSMDFPWNSNFVSMSTIQNNLIEAGFSIQEAEILNYQILYSDENFIFNKKMEKIGNRWLPLFGNLYFLVVQKKVIALTPIKPKWKKSKKITVLKEE